MDGFDPNRAYPVRLGSAPHVTLDWYELVETLSHSLTRRCGCVLCAILLLCYTLKRRLKPDAIDWSQRGALRSSSGARPASFFNTLFHIHTFALTITKQTHTILITPHCIMQMCVPNFRTAPPLALWFACAACTTREAS